jgi:uncharacterized protein
MNTLDGPLPASERIATLDIVRGFALLGILIMNMPGFANSFFVEADGSYLWSHPVDRAAEVVRDMLFSGKFNSMFSLLFGIGFTIQYERMRRRAPGHATTLYLRRLAVLLALGLFHAMVIWPGDVLHVYALLGFLLLAVLNRASDRTIAVLLGLCLLYPAVSGVLRLLLTTPEITARLVAEARALEASNNLAYGSGSLLDTVREHTGDFTYMYSGLWQIWGSLGFYVQMATTMLIGLLIGRHQWMYRIAELMPRVRRLQWIALGIGLACALVFGIIFQVDRAPGPSPLKVLGSIAYVLSRLGLMAFYVLTIVRLAQRPAWQARFAPIAAAGRLPLTNYLMQSVLCTALFYGWGLGLWGKVGPAAQLALAFAIFFLVQVPASLWWLHRFEQGPLEYLWRVLTYGRQAPVRASAGTA